MRSRLWLIGGPNGAGKSTFVQAAPLEHVLPGVAFVNPDSIASQLLQARGFHGFADASEAERRKTFLDAADQVASILDRYVEQGVAIGAETVLSSDKYKPLVERVVHRQGFFGFVYVALDSPERAIARVRMRVREGGHDVPDEKVRNRFARSLANLPWFASRASQFFVFDNSSEDPALPPQLIAYGALGRIRKIDLDANPLIVTQLAALVS